MKRTKVLQENRIMRFEDIYGRCTNRSLTQEEAAEILGVSSRTFRRYINRYEEGGLMALYDKRLEQRSNRRAPVDEANKLVDSYRQSYLGWNVKHFHSWYSRSGGTRSYSWVKNTLQSYGVVKPVRKRGVHRIRRDPSPLPGMMIHQDASTHEWVPGQKWDLIVTMDDATNEIYSMFFCYQEGTASSFRGVREVIEKHGRFCKLYTDRGSHYWHTPKAGGKVDKTNPTQFGRGLKQLDIEMIAAYSPQARGRSERVFGTHQDRLVKELAKAGITDMETANDYIQTTYLPAYNAEFKREAREEGSAFVPYQGLLVLDDILCEHHDRVVGCDNCVQFEGLVLQIPADRHRHHYVKAKVKVMRHHDESLSIYYGPRLLAKYTAGGSLIAEEERVAA